MSAAGHGSGRDELLTDLANQVSAGRGALVCGPPGSGVTHALRITAERLERDGLRVAVGPFATADVVLDTSADVVVVDDIDRCPLAVVDAVAERADAGRPIVVGSHDATAAPAVERLWRRRLIGRVDLGPLDFVECERLIRSHLGAAVDVGTARRLARMTSGWPLLLEEVIESARSTDDLRFDSGLWRLYDWPSVTPRIRDLLDEAAAPLDPEEERVLDAVAIGENLPLTLIRALVDDATLIRLEQRGRLLVDDAPESRVRFSSPLDALVRRHDLGVVARRSIAGRLLDAATEHPVDDLTRARLSVAAGEPLARETLIATGQAALADHDLDLAHALATACPEAPELQHVLACVLEAHGQTDEAADIHRRVLADPRTPPDVRAFAATDLASLLLWSLGQGDAAIEIARELTATMREVDDDLADESEAFHAAQLVFSGRIGDGLAIIEPLLPRLRGRARAVACMVASAANAIAGHTSVALDIATEGTVVRQGLGAQLTLTGVEIHEVDRLFALRFGGRLDEARTVARSVLAESLERGPAHAPGWVSIVAALVALDQGALDDAESHAARASSIFGAVGNRAARRWAVSEQLFAAALRGHRDEVEEALHRLDDAGPSAVGFMEPEVQRARAWATLALGSSVDSERQLLAAAQYARDSGQRSIEALILHDLVRVGSKEPVVDRLVELQVQSDSALGGPRVRHATAWERRDPESLLAVSAEFADIGSPLWAAEAAAQAAAVFLELGRGTRGRAAARLAHELAGQTDAAVTPPLAAAWTLSLTSREREIAEAAASGQASRAIGDALGISTRTVDNLLGRVYAKLGIGGRAELAGLVTGVAKRTP